MKTLKPLALVAAVLVYALFCSTANATGHHSTPPPDPKPVSTATSGSVSGAKAGAKSHSTSHATSSSSAKGGNANASGGDSVATSGDSRAVTGDSAASSDNAVNVSSDDDVNIPRQVPPVLLPMIMTSGCGAGVNAGGAGTGGAGAAGLTWTTAKCYQLRTAINFFAIGDYETGCELLVDLNREAFARIKKKPDCSRIALRLTEQSAHVDTSKFATKEQLDRAFRTGQAK